MMTEELVEKQSVNVVPKIGEIWAVAYPIMFYDEADTLCVKIQTRPFLILDDGRGLIVEESSDYHGFKLTSQRRSHKNRKEIKNWKEKGLKKKSYVRIEIPMKIEYQQFRYKITELDDTELLEMYKALYNLLNIDALEKMANQ